jgi:hypothetical protein
MGKAIWFDPATERRSQQNGGHATAAVLKARAATWQALARPLLEAGLSLAEVGRRVGISPCQVSEYRKRLARP